MTHWSQTINHSNKSRVKFFGNFRDELRETIAILEVTIERVLSEKYSIDSIISGRSDIKIRINDTATGIEKLINCIFRYHHDDEKYGYVHIELTSYELSLKPRVHFMGKYSVTDRKNIEKDVLQDLIICIEAI